MRPFFSKAKTPVIEMEKMDACKHINNGLNLPFFGTHTTSDALR